MRNIPSLWAGRITTGVAALFLGFDATGKLLAVPEAVKATTELGFASSTLTTLAIIQLVCLALYVLPPTAVLGALRGPEMIRAWLTKWPGETCRGSRLVFTAACGSPAFGQYRPQPDATFAPWALIVLELAGDRIAGINIFHDTATLFPRFGLALALNP